MYVYVCSSVEERLCRTLELKITNQSINQSINQSGSRDYETPKNSVQDCTIL